MANDFMKPIPSISSGDDQFYPEGIPGVMFKGDITAEGMRMDPNFHVKFPGHRADQTRLQRGELFYRFPIAFAFNTSSSGPARMCEPFPYYLYEAANVV
ncbi:MAG: selenium-binding family protein [Firmicutes bacterium]|nr:selenium-binding family protein [Bacillota bacterium]